MSSMTITMAFLMGLAGSLHCAGMCGPIIWVMPFQALGGLKKWMGIALYHFGRITIYAALGLLLYSFTSIFQPQWQQYISIAMGAALLLIGVFTFFPNNFKLRLPWAVFVQNQLARFMAKPQLSALIFTGMLNGLLPCGLVYMALAASVTAGSSLQAMTLMYAFGTGTTPMLIAITVLKNKNVLRIGTARKLVPVVMLCIGSLFVLRGMNLGIPYLSPKVVIENKEVKTSCCERPATHNDELH